LIIACDSCGTVIDLDLTVKRRGPNAPIRIDDVRCPRCNGYGRAHCRIFALSADSSVCGRLRRSSTCGQSLISASVVTPYATPEALFERRWLGI
jgi:hypothetical protein